MLCAHKTCYHYTFILINITQFFLRKKIRGAVQELEH